MIRSACGFAVAFALASPAFAGDGCGKLAWPLDKERQQFAATPAMTAKTGYRLPRLPSTALVLHLDTANDVKFVLPPERKPKAAEGLGLVLE